MNSTPASLMRTAIMFWLLSIGVLPTGLAATPFAAVDPADTPAGYLTRLLINEVPFPGEKGYVSENNTRDAMHAVLWVLHGRLKLVPAGYTQQEIAAIRTRDFIDIITAGGRKGQCDGFYRRDDGQFACVPRVEERLQYLLKIANSGKQAGRFSRLINHAVRLARDYQDGAINAADRYANLKYIAGQPVTGRAYGWMTDRSFYHPGGAFVAIPKEHEGIMGGNRFFTLMRKEVQK